MIDIENQVFNRVANALQAEYGDISVESEYVESPSSFPHVSLVEDDNSDVIPNSTLTRQPETVADLMYTASVYSNKASGKKSQAKAIMDLIDAEMHKMGFHRTMRSQLPNVDRSIYRVVARYTQRYQQF